MTNKERYKQAFSVLHTSDQFSVEVENMSSVQKQYAEKDPVRHDHPPVQIFQQRIAVFFIGTLF